MEYWVAFPALYSRFLLVISVVAISFSRRSSWPRDWTRVSHIVDRRFTVWATREAQLIYSSGYTGEGSGTPLQYFYLENPMDRGAC